MALNAPLARNTRENQQPTANGRRSAGCTRDRGGILSVEACERRREALRQDDGELLRAVIGEVYELREVPRTVGHQPRGIDQHQTPLCSDLAQDLVQAAFHVEKAV